MSFALRFSMVLFTASSLVFCNEPQGGNNKWYNLMEKFTALFNRKIDRVVEGDIFRVPSLGSIINESEPNVDGYELRTGNAEPAIKVWATTKGYKDTLIIHLSKEEREDKEGSCNWADHGHPRLYKFPEYLPLNLFVDKKGELKKEGDTITLLHNNPKTNEHIKVLLTLRQGSYRYEWCGGGKFDECIRTSDKYNSIVKPYLKYYRKQGSPLYGYDKRYRLFMGY